MITAQMFRMHRLSSGIFGKLVVLDIPFYTAEHSYSIGDDTGAEIYIPKVPEGIYKCKRYFSPKHNCDVFMLIDVPDFTGNKVSNIEIHILNFPQKESSGCIGIGKTLDLDADTPMIGLSKDAFREFMLLFDGENEFTLSIT